MHSRCSVKGGLQRAAHFTAKVGTVTPQWLKIRLWFMLLFAGSCGSSQQNQHTTTLDFTIQNGLQTHPSHDDDDFQLFGDFPIQLFSHPAIFPVYFCQASVNLLIWFLRISNTFNTKLYSYQTELHKFIYFSENDPVSYWSGPSRIAQLLHTSPLHIKVCMYRRTAPTVSKWWTAFRFFCHSIKRNPSLPK